MNQQLFGIEFAHSSLETAAMPPELPARMSLTEYQASGDLMAEATLLDAATDINRLTVITQENEDGSSWDLIDIFTADQILEMHQRVQSYLGMSLDEHLKSLRMPPNYPLYIGKLAAHYMLTDSTVTGNFGDFERRHTDPEATATGPWESNSRQYAEQANQRMLRQFRNYYETKFDVKLTGPTKHTDSGQVVWERGVAECQFLILDCVRDSLAAGHRSGRQTGGSSMTVDDVERNIIALTANRDRLKRELRAVNPLIADYFSLQMDNILELTAATFHRGRLDVPLYRREPNRARTTLMRIETTLMEAAAMTEVRPDQEEIPIL